MSQNANLFAQNGKNIFEIVTLNIGDFKTIVLNEFHI
jgi:hypothetical protein